MLLSGLSIDSSIARSLISQPHSRIQNYSVSRKNNLYATKLDSIELTKIFGRCAAKTILLDIPGAGTPEMSSCCHGGDIA